MPDPKSEPEQWTAYTLKVFLSAKIDALQELLNQRQHEMDRALELALKSVDKRLESMNEFRQLIQDQRLIDEKARQHINERFLTREIYSIDQDSIKKLLEKHVEYLTKLVQKNSDTISEMDKKLFAVSELKADKREGLNTKYMTSTILFSALSFIVAAIATAWAMFRGPIR